MAFVERGAITRAKGVLDRWHLYRVVSERT
jgi:hypothetical protein